MVEADDITEPVADISRSILDGHISLSRALANKNHYPAVDVLESISRVMIDIVDDGHKKLANELLDAYKGEGETIKRRDELHRMAEANRAFAHYRW